MEDEDVNNNIDETESNTDENEHTVGDDREDIHETDHEDSVDSFSELRNVRKKNPCNTLISYLNINSLKNKFFEVADILYDKVPDILFLSKTKLDDTFTQGLFSVPGYRVFRNDRNIHGGGILCYVKSTLPARRRQDLEFSAPFESLVLDLVINDRKWAIIGVYRPPSVSDDIFNTLFVKHLDKITTMFDHFMIVGDLNYNLLDQQKGKPLLDLCDVFDLTNVIKSETCFTKIGKPSLVDVLLSNQPQYLFSPINFDCGLSDYHNLIGILVKGKTPFLAKEKVQYRSFKNFNESDFNQDVNFIPFHVAYVFDDPDDVYWAHETLLKDVVDDHIPVKERRNKTNKPAFMNCEPRRAIYKKRMLRKSYFTCKSSKNWEKYRKQRNFVTRLKRHSLRVYFFERCHGGPKSKDFWPTIKPFVSKKGSKDDPTINLNEENTIVSEQKQVCDIFNEYFINVAKDIESSNDNDFDDHSSILKIQDHNNQPTEPFDFKPVLSENVLKDISKLQTKRLQG
ncbi:hypothetical protein FSP39_010594 [Pinctada imbricata]|uniref:Endonuclease/exonuclease/phosphatase domain-containing protein n=1 Tax=Pinctada imbricata TaxID=66713 RepID=A0AA89C0G2_PINIB|nr:hypothetical protein FSP39_010594 [Pinctada imbricata]